MGLTVLEDGTAFFLNNDVATGSTGSVVIQRTGNRSEPVDITLGTRGDLRPTDDGDLIAYTNNELAGTISFAVLNVETGLTRTIPIEAQMIGMTWNPDHDQLAYSTFVFPKTELHIANGPSFSDSRLIELSELNFSVVMDWLPDGDRLLLVGSPGGMSDMDIYTYSLEASELTLKIDREDGISGALASPDGRYVILSSSSDMSSQEWEIASLDGGGFIPFQDDEAENFEWAADGRSLYYKRRGENHIFQIPITLDPEFRITGEPTIAFESNQPISRYWPIGVSGEFLFVFGGDAANPNNSFDVVLNWMDHLDELAPPTK